MPDQSGLNAPQIKGRGTPAPVGGIMAADTSPPGGPPPEVSFPYGFPKAGAYRIFVQMKRAGTIETGIFDAKVEN